MAATVVAPWRAALGGVGRSKSAMLATVALVLIVASSLGAPLWADAAGTGPYANHLTDYIEQDGLSVPVVEFDGVPIGPTYGAKYFLGADANGRDVMVRLLYGGRNSLAIGVVATIFSLLIGAALGILAGYRRGVTDAVISRGLDVLWALPVILLGVALGVATALGGIDLGFVTIRGGSILMTATIIGVLNVVYIARPIRATVLSLREQAFVEAARAQGAGSARIMRREILPNVTPTLLALAPVTLMQSITVEAALSFLGAGVQQPKPSWGTMLDEGIDQLITAPHLTLVPGAFLVVTVLALTTISDIVREALDPRGDRMEPVVGGLR